MIWGLINMKLFELLSPGPGINKPLRIQIAGIIKFVQKNCSIALDEMLATGKYLLRGTREDNQTVFIGQSRTDSSRLPADTPLITQSQVDDSLYQAGFKALRSNSIFCSSTIRTAREYGSPYAIFPVNGFEYTWSSKIFDLTGALDGCELPAEMALISDIRELPGKEFARKYEFHNSVDLKGALMSDNEIYIRGTYLAVKWAYLGDPHGTVVDVFGIER